MDHCTIANGWSLLEQLLPDWEKKKKTIMVIIPDGCLLLEQLFAYWEKKEKIIRVIIADGCPCWNSFSLTGRRRK